MLYEPVDADNGSQLHAMEEKIARFARVSHYVLITGERGTGKTTIARRIHESSPRARCEFVSVNCASFTAELLESELFGYEKGAFTGAAQPKAGLFETSAGGTLFLDEIGELSLALQAKLLKAVEEKRIRRVGGTSEREIDVRVIAATSRDLLAMVSDGAFRADLFDRLNILHLETVPLRLQPANIRKVFADQLEIERVAIGRDEPFEVDDDAFVELEAFAWKGNYRELRNFATRLAVEAIDAQTITAEVARNLLDSISSTALAEIPKADDSSSAVTKQANRRDLVTVVFDPESDDLDSVYIKAVGSFVEHALRKTNGNLRRAARSMNTSHSTLSRILKRHRGNSVPPVDADDDTTSGMVAA